MKPLWLLGADIQRSPSPAMHNAGLAAMGLPPAYALRPCTPEDLQSVLDEAEVGCRGVNVTAPHKAAVARRYADVLDDTARTVGAVNTVVFDEGRARVAMNTDVAGLMFAWRRANMHVRDRVLAVVGAGGAARAVVVAARQAGARRLVVHARRASAAQELVAHAWSCGLDAEAADRPIDASMVVLAAAHLELPEAWLRRTLARPGAVHDLRYGTRTRSVRNAALAAGHLFADGSLMLLAQARAALAAFVGAPLPDAATSSMARALAEAVSFGEPEGECG